MNSRDNGVYGINQKELRQDRQQELRQDRQQELRWDREQELHRTDSKN